MIAPTYPHPPSAYWPVFACEPVAAHVNISTLHTTHHHPLAGKRHCTRRNASLAEGDGLLPREDGASRERRAAEV